MGWLTGSADLGRQSTLSVQAENTRWKNHTNRKENVEQNEFSNSAAKDKSFIDQDVNNLNQVNKWLFARSLVSNVCDMWDIGRLRKPAVRLS